MNWTIDVDRNASILDLLAATLGSAVEVCADAHRGGGFAECYHPLPGGLSRVEVSVPVHIG
jgi:hypothetical protein